MPRTGTIRVAGKRFRLTHVLHAIHQSIAFRRSGARASGVQHLRNVLNSLACIGRDAECESGGGVLTWSPLS
jgi:hypothetical protein